MPALSKPIALAALLSLQTSEVSSKNLVDLGTEPKQMQQEEAAGLNSFSMDTVLDVADKALNPNLQDAAKALASVGTKSILQFDKPPGLTIGAVLHITSTLMCYFDKSDAGAKLLVNGMQKLHENVDLFVEGQRELINELNDLRSGQREILDLVNDTNEAIHLQAYQAVLRDNMFLQSDGIPMISQKYSELIDMIQVRTQSLDKQNFSSQDGTKEIILKAGELAKEFLEQNPNLEIYMGVYNIWRLVQDPAVIKNENSAIGVWTAANLYSEWEAHRAELYLLQMLSQMYKDYNSNQNLQVTDAQLFITKRFEHDLTKMNKWGEEYFTYPAHNGNYDGEQHNHPEWEKKWSNALTWDDWMVKQCVERYGSKHSLHQSTDYCVQMWKCEQTPDYFWDKNLDSCYEKKNYYRTEQRYDGFDTLGFSDSGDIVSGRYEEITLQSPRYFLCGFQERAEKYQGSWDDDEGITSVIWRYCNIDDWNDQKWVWSDLKDVHDGEWQAETLCPEGFYGANIETRSVGDVGDDSGLEAIKLLCYDKTWQWHSYATNKFGHTSCAERGTDDEGQWCSFGNWQSGELQWRGFIQAVDTRIEPAQGFWYDDEGVTQIRVHKRLVKSGDMGDELLPTFENAGFYGYGGM